MPTPLPIRLAAAAALVGALSVASLAARSAEPRGAAVDGVWDATVQLKDATDIPFKLDLGGDAAHVRATYFDGERPVRASTGGTFRTASCTWISPATPPSSTRAWMAAC
ncbi:MAG: hypothetical protein WDN45_00540 [Caulobacteraceae bacterium]